MGRHLAPTTAPLPDLAALVAYYRDLFGLRDWAIEAEWADDLECYARVLPLPERRMARMVVSTACPAGELRATIAHELIHVLLSPLTAVSEPSAGAVMLEEQAVEALALAITRAEATPAEVAVMRKALAAVPARMRARLSIPALAPRQRSGGSMQLDPEMAKKMADAVASGDAAACLECCKECLVMAASETAEPDGDEVDTSALNEEAAPADPEKPGEKPMKERAADAVRALGEMVLVRLGEKDPIRAKGRLGAALDEAARARTEGAAIRKAADAARRERLWETAINDGRVKLAQAFARKDGADGKPVRVYARWAEAQNGAYPELAAFEGWIDSLPRGAHQVENATASTVLADVSADRQAGSRLSIRDRQEAKRVGVDPDQLAAQIELSNRGARRAEEGV